MNFNKPISVLKTLPKKLNNFYIKNLNYSLGVKNKSKDKRI